MLCDPMVEMGRYANCGGPAAAAFATANPPLATLSEALRGPLIPLIGFAEILASGGLPPDVARRYGAEILAGGRSLLALLDQLLTLASGRPADPAVPPETTLAAEDALKALRSLLGESLDRVPAGRGNADAPSSQ